MGYFCAVIFIKVVKTLVKTVSELKGFSDGKKSKRIVCSSGFHLPQQKWNRNHCFSGFMVQAVMSDVACSRVSSDSWSRGSRGVDFGFRGTSL